MSVLGGMGFLVVLVFFSSLVRLWFFFVFKLLESTSHLVQTAEFWVQIDGGILVSSDCAIS